EGVAARPRIVVVGEVEPGVAAIGRAARIIAGRRELRGRFAIAKRALAAAAIRNLGKGEARNAGGDVEHLADRLLLHGAQRLDADAEQRAYADAVFGKAVGQMRVTPADPAQNAIDVGNA